MVRPAQQIVVDFYHAVEHAGEVLAALIGKEHPDYKNRQHQWAKRLLKNKVRVLIEQTRQKALPAAPGAEGGGYGSGLLCSYHQAAMQHGNFRAKWLLLSAQEWVEAGCKTVIGARCKQSGMFWSELGAEKDPGAALYSTAARRLEEFWKKTALNGRGGT